MRDFFASEKPDVVVLAAAKVGGIQAVSYTHLRAHETVLDLVCRLLLEKKKPNNTKHSVSPLRYTRYHTYHK